MANELTTTTNRRTLTWQQSLPEKLLGAVLSGETVVVAPKYRQRLKTFSEAPEPPNIGMEEVEKMVGLLSLATAYKKPSKEEAAAQLKLYYQVLSDLPIDDVRAAYQVLVRKSTFLPKPAEIREEALRAGAERKYAKSRARYLVFMSEQEWKPRGPVMTPEEFAQAKAELEKRDD